MHLGDTLLKGTGFPARCNGQKQNRTTRRVECGAQANVKPTFSSDLCDLLAFLEFRRGARIRDPVSVLNGQRWHISCSSPEGAGTAGRLARRAMVTREAKRTRQRGRRHPAEGPEQQEDSITERHIMLGTRRSRF